MQVIEAIDDLKTFTHYIVMEFANGSSLFSDQFYRNIKQQFVEEVEEYLDTSSIEELNNSLSKKGGKKADQNSKVLTKK